MMAETRFSVIAPKRIALALLVILMGASLHFTFMRPVAEYFDEGIPYAPASFEALTLVPGDHLQLLYHFQLAHRMMTGEIPWFHNVYEFNTGDDSARRVLDPYYFPFSMAFSIALCVTGNDASAWNISQLLSSLIGFWLLFLLARRYGGHSSLAGCCVAVIAMCLPYRWATLTAGSPTGFGMVFIPGVALGVDMAIRDRRIRGGLLAGLMLLMCYTTDLHCFLFAVLSLPVWCLAAWCMSGRGIWPTRHEFWTALKTLSPVFVILILSLFIARFLMSGYAATNVADGRTWEELIPASPILKALFIFRFPSLTTHFFYIGRWLMWLFILSPIVIGAICIARGFGVNAHKSTPFKAILAAAIIVSLSLVLMFLLALGTRGPMDGLPIRIARALIPPYAMIRQPLKIFCLLPTMAALLFSLLFFALRRLSDRRSFKPVWVALCIGTAAYSVSTLYPKYRTSACLLSPASPAYTAAVSAAEEKGLTPRALALPLWEGASAWSSIYEYHAIKSGLRMINGYAPVIDHNYVENVFSPLETITQGDLTPQQMAALRELGVNTLIVHEAAFPDVASRFPVGITLQRLLTHPHLALLAQDGPIWSFQLLEQPRKLSTTEQGMLPRLFAPAAIWNFTDRQGNGRIPGDRGPTGTPISLFVRTPAQFISNAIWRVRCRNGHLYHAYYPDENDYSTLKPHVVDDWTWLNIPAKESPGDRYRFISFHGSAEVSDVIYAMDDTHLTGDKIYIHAADIFHAGYTLYDEHTGEFLGIRFRPRHDPAAEIAYGPNLPIEAGRWRITVDAVYEDGSLDEHPIKILLGGRPADVEDISHTTYEFVAGREELLQIQYAYTGQAPVTLKGFLLEKVREASSDHAEYSNTVSNEITQKNKSKPTTKQGD